MKRKILYLAFVIALLIPAISISAKTTKRTSITITEGKTYKLTVISKKKLKWRSKKKSIATITSRGKITGKKKGTTYVYAKNGKKKYKYKIIVEKPFLSTTKCTITAGNQYALKLNNCSRSKTFSSNNTSVATVSSKGIIKAKREGIAKIIVKISDKTYCCVVTVKNKTSKSTIHIPAGTQNDPINAYETFTSDMYYNANYLGNFSIKLLNFQHGKNITGITPITKLGKNNDEYDPDKYEYLYLKFQVKYNYGKDILNAFDLFKNRDVTTIGVFYYDFFDTAFNNHMSDWVRSPRYYDSCSNIFDTKLLPGDIKVFSLLMIIPKNQKLLGYRLQTGVNIGSSGDDFYTFKHFVTK